MPRWFGFLDSHYARCVSARVSRCITQRNCILIGGRAIGHTRARSYVHIRIPGILGPHVIMVITSTIGSSALATHEPSTHAAYTFRIASTPARRNTLGWDRETRAWSPAIFTATAFRAIESQGHGCKVCICFITGFVSPRWQVCLHVLTSGT